MPPMVLPDELKKQARDFEIHWVTETGKKPAKLTANLSINPTVLLIYPLTKATRPTNTNRTPSPPALPSTLSLWVLL